MKEFEPKATVNQSQAQNQSIPSPKNNIRTMLKDFISKIFLNPTFILAALTGLLYLQGYFWYLRYLREFGVSSGFFPYGFEVFVRLAAIQSLYRLFLFLGVVLMAAIVMMVVAVCIGVLIYFLTRTKPAKKILEWVRKPIIRTHNTSKIAKTIDRVGSLLMYMLGVLVPIVAALLVIAYFGILGQDEAKDSKIKWNTLLNTANHDSNRESDDDNMIIITYQEPLQNVKFIKGFSVATSETYCAIYTKVDSLHQVIVIPRERIESVTIFQ